MVTINITRGLKRWYGDVTLTDESPEACETACQLLETLLTARVPSSATPAPEARKRKPKTLEMPPDARAMLDWIVAHPTNDVGPKHTPEQTQSLKWLLKNGYMRSFTHRTLDGQAIDHIILKTE